MTRRILLLAVLLGCAPDGPAIQLSDPYAFEPVLGKVAAVYFTVDNRGALPDTLVEVEVSGALIAMVHEQVADGERVEMRHVGSLPIPAHGTVQLKPGGLHVMIEGMERPPVAGDTLLLMARFARAGVDTLRVPVVPYGSRE